jgi:hypothetical protein
MAKNNLPEAARGTVEREATYEQSVATDQQGESPVMGMRRKAAKEVEEYFDYYKGALTDNFKRITDHCGSPRADSLAVSSHHAGVHWHG